MNHLSKQEFGVTEVHIINVFESEKSLHDFEPEFPMPYIKFSMDLTFANVDSYSGLASGIDFFGGMSRYFDKKALTRKSKRNEDVALDLARKAIACRQARKLLSKKWADLPYDWRG